MKKLLLALLLLLPLSGFCQEDEHQWFVGVGVDPVVSLDKSRVGGGHLNYAIQFGREYYKDDALGYKFGLYWEQFQEINFTSYGTFVGITFQSPSLFGWRVGDYWFATGEINLIDRRGIGDNSLIYNADSHTSWSLGVNLGMRIEKPFNLPFNVEFVVNFRDRPDIRVHYSGTGAFKFRKEDIVVSGFVYVVVPFN